MRGTERCPFYEMGHFPLEPGDVIVYLSDHPDGRKPTTKDQSHAVSPDEPDVRRSNLAPDDQ